MKTFCINNYLYIIPEKKKTALFIGDKASSLDREFFKPFSRRELKRNAKFLTTFYQESEE
jgi:hypothetical protein